MEGFSKKQKTLVVVAVAILAILVLGSFLSTPQAKANPLQDLWNGFLNAFTPKSATNTADNSANSTPLYQPAIDYEQAVVDAVKKASPAVVSITISKNVPIIENCPYDPFGNLPPEFQQFFGDGSGLTQPCDSGQTQLQQVGGGSGFIVSSDGLILTNKHVAGDKTASYTVFTNDGKKYDAKILAVDPTQDLAVIKIDATGLPTVTLGDSGSLELGQTAIAIGNALGEFSNTVSVGVVSGLSRTVTASGPDVGSGSETIQGVIQTDAAINPGNSGGPLLNLRGEVVGINTAIAEGAQNIGFAIPINRAKNDISSVQSTGEIVTPFLGVRYLAVTPDVAKAQNLPVDYGALVRGSDQGAAVTPDSPAAKAGLQAEDIILEINGQKIDSTHALGDEISKYKVGDTISLKINRAGKEMVLNATLSKRPAGQ